MINPDTRVAVCCYQGDANQVVDMMPLYTQHNCPLLVLSPETPDTARVDIPGVECRYGGKQCYIGWDGVERMKRHLSIMLEYPENFFLVHDADSILLDPVIPREWYSNPDWLWANRVDNGVPEQQRGFSRNIPKVAFHPPWFLSRRVIERLLAHGDTVQPNPYLPFIDYWMVEASVHAGIPWKDMVGRMSVPMVTHLDWACDCVRKEGYTVIHSCKGMKYAQPLIDARKRFLAGDRS